MECLIEVGKHKIEVINQCVQAFPTQRKRSNQIQRKAASFRSTKQTRREKGKRGTRLRWDPPEGDNEEPVGAAGEGVVEDGEGVVGGAAGEVREAGEKEHVGDGEGQLEGLTLEAVAQAEDVVDQELDERAGPHPPERHRRIAQYQPRPPHRSIDRSRSPRRRPPIYWMMSHNLMNTYFDDE